MPLAAGRFSLGAALGLLLAAWVFTACAALLLRQTRHGGASLRHAGAAFWGMLLAHVGVGVFIVGVTMVKAYEVQRDATLKVGEQVEIAGWRLTLNEVAEVAGPNYMALRARVQAVREGEVSIVLTPEKRVYRMQAMPMTEAAIDHGLTRDLYVALGDAVDPRTWVVRVHVKPFVTWIWGGALLMAIGGLIAVADRRYRRVAIVASSPAAGWPRGEQAA